MSTRLIIKRLQPADVLDIRSSVLRPNQPRSKAVYPFDDEIDTCHIGGVSEGKLASIGTVFREARADRASDHDWRIRGMATLPEFRGQGFGRAVLEAIVEYCRTQGGREVWCNARTSATGFYEMAGFSRHGGEFELEGIGPHFVMRLELNT